MNQKPRVLIDADACPKKALQIAVELCQKNGYELITFASYNHQFQHDNHVVVDAGSQAVDIRLTNEAKAGDIVVTQDIGLGAMVMGKGAKSLTPHGKVFTSDSIAFDLEVRNEKARFRRGGGRTKGPHARTPIDDQHFQDALMYLMQEGGE
ncbi:DUF188 domain-containing protein [Brevibacillus laterosporus]|uniref:UPF0178 protein C4A77_13520 n=1 Tax=Brevibacillus laterosporus TaxID=1465 RepID=A0AAP8QCI0_BRELA|nr:MULTISPECIES: DUF188 domain-containing protein [Brevibacillus]ATO50839.1 hypothetical protein BrL25_18125 [Brevibacillus laterosporus DSM 25]MBG9774407.1 hypothetical protein [Brevibacillus laterosporus]MBG9787225.1 hypothetical protein [Brevibacillus laterosporus]MBG9797910.1 hypothetical protein [Brevibacillus laterosporus]MBG9804502.1 hypothetical protein [Brevibacillus laterosporus]